jgi:hypothetical protein
MSLVEDKDDIIDNLKVVNAVTIVLKALAYGETIEIGGYRLEMQNGLIYARPWHLIDGELVDVTNPKDYLGMNHMDWEYIVNMVMRLSPERLNEIKALYAIKSVLNNVDKPKRVPLWHGGYED